MFDEQERGDPGSSECTYTRTNEEGSEETIAGTDGVTHRDVNCFVCQLQGHYRNQ